MTASIPIPFPLGVPLWWANGPHREEWIECPECCGTKVIEVVLGNGERYSLDCRCCQSGYEPPRGQIKRLIFEYRPTLFVPHRVQVYGEDVSYSESPPDALSYTSVRSEHLFTTQEECQAKCDAMNAEHAAHASDHLIRSRKRAREDLAWSAHYWGSQVRQLRKDLELAEARLNRSKELKKEQAA